MLQWTLGYVCLFQLFSQSIYPGVGLLGDTVVLFLVFKETSILFSIVAVSPVQEDSIFATSSPATIIVCRFFFFNDGHSDWYKLIPLCNFDLHFYNNEWCWAFICLLATCMSFLERYLFLILSVTSVSNLLSLFLAQTSGELQLVSTAIHSFLMIMGHFSKSYTEL